MGWYIKGFDQAAKLRSTLMLAPDFGEVKNILDNFEKTS